jgi:uncharacterized protein (UPF0262 family)
LWCDLGFCDERLFFEIATVADLGLLTETEQLSLNSTQDIISDYFYVL